MQNVYRDAIDKSLLKVSKPELKQKMDELFLLKFQLFDNEIYERG